MKTITPKALFLLIAVTFFACKKDGEAGPQGPKGEDGNANVSMYTFGPVNITQGYQFNIQNMTKGKMDSSLVLMYYNPESDPVAWYPVPGVGPDNLYHTKFRVVQVGFNTGWYGFPLQLVNPDGSPNKTQYTFKKVRVFVVPASTIIVPNGRKAMPDLDNYYEVMEYYGIKD